MSQALLDPAGVRALGWSLLHFLWQGAAVAALLASLDLLLERARPQVRYLLAAAALLLMLLLPVATFEALTRPAPVEAAGITAASLDAAWPVWSPPPTALAPMDLRRRIEPLLPVLVGAWCLGVLLLSLRTVGGWALVRRLRRTRLGPVPLPVRKTVDRLVLALRVSAPVRLYQSALVEVPTLLGWLRPVILLPASALTGLTPSQLELILAHELAHVRRADYLVNLLQTAVETLLFYHPAVWWVSHRMRVEREHCCDDLAVGACGNVVPYARALADLEGLRAGPAALAMAAAGGSLFARIARLVGPPPHLSRASRGLAAVLAGGALAVALGAESFLLASPARPAAGAAALAAVVSTELMAEEESALAAGAAAPEPQADPQPREKGQPEARPQAQPQPSPRSEPRAFPLAQILELARAGVTPEYIDEMDALGYRSLTVEQLLALRAQGVSPQYVRELADAGYRDLAADQLIALRAQGVSSAFVRGLREQGLADLSLSQLLALRAQGVSPDFVAELRQAGFGDLSPSKLMALRSQGVSGRYVSELRALGYDTLSPNKLMALRSQGVTPQYVRELAELGYPGLEVPVLLALRSQGVTPAYVRGLKGAGYEGLPAGVLIELRSQGVTPEFIRELKEAGFEKLKPEELIELRRHGVRGELLQRLRGR
jgi:beta-lactamase regulating signal transducer with metallopeptidase domain